MTEELKVIISAEISNLKSKMQEAEKQVSTFKDKVKQASQDVDAKFQGIGNSVKAGVGVAAKGIAASAAALVALSASTTEYREAQAKLKTAFEQAGGSAEQAKGAYNDLYRVLGDGGQATEAASHLAKLTTGQKELEQWTTICQGVYSEFGASLPIESLTEAANETAKTGTLTGALTDALNWAGVAEEEFQAKLDACNTEAEREKLIRETLNGIYASSAAEYEKNNEQILAQRDSQAQLLETTSKLGETMAPLVTAFTNFANVALAAALPYIQQIAETYGPSLQVALEKVGEAVGQTLGFVSEHWGLITTIGAVIGGIVVAIGLYNTVAAIKAAMAVAEVTSVWGLVTAYTAQAAAMLVAIAPYVLIVAAIAAVIAIIVLCIKHWDDIKEAAKKAWDSIKEKTQEAVAKVGEAFSNMKTKISDTVSNIKTKVSDTFNNIKKTITDKINAAKSAVKSAIDAIKGFFNFKFSWPKIPMPKFSITPSGWKIGDLLKGSIPKLKITWNALGGVFDKPTIFGYGGSLQGIGEAGAEAVVPLEKNTKWMNILAEKLGELIQVDTVPVILQVDGKTFAQTAISTINQLTQQTGTLPLIIV